MIIALLTLSLINVGAGILLATTALISGWPLIAALTGAALAIQGGYTLVYLLRGAPGADALLTRILTAGEVASLLVGGLAFLQGFLYNLHPRNGGFEFAPMSLGVLMAVQAFVALAFLKQRGAERWT